MRPGDMLPRLTPETTRALRPTCGTIARQPYTDADLDARLKLRDDPYAERAEGEPAHVDDPESESEER